MSTYTIERLSSNFFSLVSFYRIKCQTVSLDYWGFLEECKNVIRAAVAHELSKQKGIKSWLTLAVEFEQSKDPTKTPHCLLRLLGFSRFE